MGIVHVRQPAKKRNYTYRYEPTPTPEKPANAVWGRIMTSAGTVELDKEQTAWMRRYSLTTHVKERAALRGLNGGDIIMVAAWPDSTGPANDGATAHYGLGMTVIIAPDGAIKTAYPTTS